MTFKNYLNHSIEYLSHLKKLFSPFKGNIHELKKLMIFIKIFIPYQTLFSQTLKMFMAYIKLFVTI